MAFFDAIVSLMVDREMSISDISIMVCIIPIIGACFLCHIFLINDCFRRLRMKCIVGVCERVLSFQPEANLCPE